MRPQAFLLSFVIPLSAALGLILGGAWMLATPVIVFAVTPVLDVVTPVDTTNVASDASVLRWERAAYLGLLWAWLPVQLAFITYGATLAEGASWGTVLALAAIVGISSGAGGITVAHELMHRVDRTSRAIAELLMVSVTYAHFCVEHVMGHHATVATPEDPASARRGESVYAFWLRSIIGGVLGAGRLERERCRRKGISTFSLRNRSLRYLLETSAMYAIAYSWGGGRVALFLFVQGFVAVLLLETINYVEHYGLSRRVTERGSYEAVREAHAWSSPHRVSNYYLFRLPRHADHHRFARRPYWLLRHVDGPQLPAGYGTMVMVALVPPLWRGMMHPLIDSLPAAS